MNRENRIRSDVPVATYVAPNGARAASAGTYIAYASHIAAMAPATNIGSSTPVNLGGGSPVPTPSPAPAPTPEDTDDGDAEPASAPAGDAMERKVINDAVAYIRGLAKERGRNEEWAELTVREAANLTARDALEQNVIDIVAEDLEDLLAQVDGRTLEVNGRELTLAVAGATVRTIEPDWRHELLALITNPNVAYLLLMIGFYGIILEFYNPGMGVPGVTGVICLLLGMYALQMLPINYAGLALIIVGICLMVAEAFSPSFGVLGIGGAVAFVIGSVILMDTHLPAYQISLPIIAGVAAASVGFCVFVVGAALRARTSEVVSGAEHMLGQLAEVLADFETHGRVRVMGEVWQADSSAPVSAGDKVKITAIDGLRLEVEPVAGNGNPP